MKNLAISILIVIFLCLGCETTQKRDIEKAPNISTGKVAEAKPDTADVPEPTPVKPVKEPMEKAPGKPEPTPEKARPDVSQTPDQMMEKVKNELALALTNSALCSITHLGNLITVTLKGDLLFTEESVDLKTDKILEIEKIAKIMAKYPKTSVIIEGHTDSTGAEPYNMDLSKLRALEIKKIVVTQGVDETRITVKAFGESNPIVSNKTLAGRERNRRIELKIEPK